MKRPLTPHRHTMVTMGRLGRPHGIRGWMKLISFTDPIEQIFSYSDWHIQTQSLSWQPLHYQEWQTQGTTLLVKLPNCDTPEQAKSYTNRIIAVPREQLTPLSEGDYYWIDLEGLRVVTDTGIELGQVDHLFATGANDVMVVTGDKQRLIPYNKTTIIEVNLAEQFIRVNWDAEF